jgi:predicted small lipoprotein YifL
MSHLFKSLFAVATSAVLLTSCGWCGTSYAPSCGPCAPTVVKTRPGTPVAPGATQAIDYNSPSSYQHYDPR